MEQRLILNDSKGRKLIGILHHANKNTLFIICHGFDGSKDDFIIKQIALLLQKRGYSACRFDLTGSIIQQLKEILNISSYFKTRYKKIILVGASLGGLITALGVLENESISGLVTINGFFYLKKVAWKYYKYLLLAFISFPFSREAREMILFYFNKFKPHKIKIPTLVIYGNKDEIVNYEQSLKFHKMLRSKKTLALIKNADHALTKNEFVIDAVKIIINWFKKYD